MNAAVALYNLSNYRMSLIVVFEVKDWKDAFEQAFPDTDFGEVPEDYEEAMEYLNCLEYELRVTLF